MGNINALRDWGHARDYVRMQWMMLQQEVPKDYVIATGHQHSVRDFIYLSACELGIKLKFEGEGLNEIGIVEAIEGSFAPAISPGDIIVRIDPRYYRPTEVDSLLGDASKARSELGWAPETNVQQLCAEMVREDLILAQRDAF